MVRLAQVTANNEGFLIELVYNNSLVGFLDEYNHLYYPFVDIAAMIADGFCDWNLVKHVMRVSIFLRHGCLTSLDTYHRVSIVV